MKEEFEYGEEVMVRNDNGEWGERTYVGTMPNCKGHWCMGYGHNEKSFDGVPYRWKEIRKLQKPEPMKDLNGLTTDVKLWAQHRNLIDPANANRQMLKVIEEVGELSSCLAKGKSDLETRDAIGDTLVTLIILSECLGTDINTCLSQAYHEIAGRTGKTVDGVFIKDEL
jgi:NTP pyrophosphatase (non-canonical NTP hydrolase)